MTEHPDRDDTAGEPPREQSAPQEPPREGRTPGGYEYTVVDETQATPPSAEPAPPPEPPATREPRRFTFGLPVLLALIIIPAAIVGAIVWFVASMDGDGGGDARLERNVANVLGAFFSQEGSVVERYEGRLPPAFPEGIPEYPGARVVSSIAQTSGEDAQFLVVYDTRDDRQKVGDFFAESLDEDPWQVELEQAARESTVQQFSNIEDADIQGIVLLAESDNEEVTTIFMSVQVVGGADDVEHDDFDPGVSRALPAGFPEDDVPMYADATIIESAFQRAPNQRNFLVSLITEDAPSDVIDFYREHFEDNGYTVEDLDAQQLPPDGEGFTFTGEGEDALTGSVVAGEFPDDDAYTQIDLQVSSPN